MLSPFVPDHPTGSRSCVLRVTKGIFFCDPSDILVFNQLSGQNPSWSNAGERQAYVAGFTAYSTRSLDSMFGGAGWSVQTLCRVIRADSGPVSVHATVHDAGGNYLGPASGTWSIAPLPGARPADRLAEITQALTPAADGRSATFANPGIASMIKIKKSTRSAVLCLL